MTDPVTHVTTAVIVGAGTASVTAGAIYGVEYVVIGLALLGGAVAHVWIARMLVTQMILSIIGSTVIGVMCAQFSASAIASTIIHFAPWLKGNIADGSIGTKILVAFWAAFFAQKTIPIIFKWLDSKGA